MTYSKLPKDHEICNIRTVVTPVENDCILLDGYLELAVRLGWASWNALDEASLLPETCARWQRILLLRLSVNPIQLRGNKILHFLVVRICKTVPLGLRKCSHKFEHENLAMQNHMLIWRKIHVLDQGALGM